MIKRLTQNHIEHLMNKVELGQMTADQFNVEQVKIGRVLLVVGRIPASVRKTLNAAVKNGELKHIKKDGRKPESYYHPDFEHLMKEDRANHERKTLEAIRGVFVDD